MKCEIRNRNGAGAILATVEAEGIEQAAGIYARRHNSRRGVGAWRDTGDPGKSGVFRSTHYLSNGTTSIDGPSFHVCTARAGH